MADLPGLGLSAASMDAEDGGFGKAVPTAVKAKAEKSLGLASGSCPGDPSVRRSATRRFLVAPGQRLRDSSSVYLR